MSNMDNTSREISYSSQIESIVPMQQIASLESDRKDKINIPHRSRVKKSIITQQNDLVKLNKLGKCTPKKSVNSLSPANRFELHSNIVRKNKTCAQCNEPIIQMVSGKIKPCNMLKVTSHGDNDKITTFYKKDTFSCKSIHREGEDATSASLKTSNINRWLKSNWKKLTKDKWRYNEADVLKKCTQCSQNEIVPAETDGVCGMVRRAYNSEFPFVFKEIRIPMTDQRSGRNLYATPGDGDGSSKDEMQRCCGSNACMCCKLACRLFGCKCKRKGGCCPVVCCPATYPPVATVSLNALERAHLQNLYNTPCSSVQFSGCNCAVQNASVKRNTTGAHYFAHKGLRQVDVCTHHNVCSRSSSSTSSSIVTRKSYVTYSVKSAVREDYGEDDDCCCKCCDQAMISIDCQTDSRLHLGHLVQTEPQRKKCRPCCKCCRCNKKGGRCSTSCKHFQLNTEEASRARVVHHQQQPNTSKSDSAQLQRKRSSMCCNKCTGIPYRIRGGQPYVDRVAYKQLIAAERSGGLKGTPSPWSGFDKYSGLSDRVRGGANSMDGSCVSCKQRLNAVINRNLFGDVIPSKDKEFITTGNQESWLSRKNIAKFLGIDKKSGKCSGYRFGKQDVCDICKIDLRRTPHLAKRFSQKINRKELNRLLALRNWQNEHQQQFDKSKVNLNSSNVFNNRSCAVCNPITDQHFNNHLSDLLAANQQYDACFNNRNCEVLNYVPSKYMQLLRKRTAHKPRKHAHRGRTHAGHQQRTLIYKTHSTQCITKTQDQGTSCLADFKQATELGYKLNVLPQLKMDKYRKLFNEASGKFRSPITGREYNLKLERMDYKTGLLHSDLPALLEVGDTLPPKMGRFGSRLSNYKENNDSTIMNAICDAFLLTKDIGAAGEFIYESNNSSVSSSNTINSITDADVINLLDNKLNKYFNEPMVYRTETIMNCDNILNESVENETELPNNNDVVNLFIQSQPNNNIYTNKNISLRSAMFKPKKRSSATKMPSREFQSFILDNMPQRKSNSKNQSRVLDQFKSYQLSGVKTNSDFTMKSVEVAFEDIKRNDSMPQCSLPNFIHQNLSVFSNTISDTYSLLKILEHNQEKLPDNASFDEQIENVINYSSFINDNC